MSWRDDALCNNTDPNLYDLDWIENTWGISDWQQQDEYAKTVCAGCPVIRECAKDALETIDIADYALTPDSISGPCQTEGVVRAGLALRPQRGSRHRGRKRLAVLAGVEWIKLSSNRVRNAGVCVVCGRPFADVVVWGVARASARLCVFCKVDARVA
jgi:hypothetical protein